MKFVRPAVLVMKKIRIQIKNKGKKNFGPNKTREAPKNVEAPLPPLNLKKTGKI